MHPLHDPLTTGSDQGHPYRAQLLRPDVVEDRETLDELRRDRTIAVFDTIQRQLWELVKARHPARRLEPAEHQALVDRELAGRVEREYGVWAFYGWSRRLVHLLDGPAFAELRTNRNCYKISPSERDTLAGKRIGVVGLSVGQSVAVVLALERAFGELRLADFDTLDLSNLNRLRAGVHNLGVPKVLVTAREIAEIDPFLNVVCFPDGITPNNLEPFLQHRGRLDLVIEECDSIDLKIEIRHAARRLGIPVLMDTSDRGLLDIERFDLEPERPIFHGLAGDLDPTVLRGLSTEEKVPYVLKIIGADTISARMRASLLEIEQTISTWPQLASAVAMGGAVAADAARRILLGQLTVSGRFFVDVDESVSDFVPPGSNDAIDAPPPSGSPRAPVLAEPSTGRDLPVEQLRRLVSAATLAPSGGNAQPWRWLWQARRLYLFIDASQSRTLLDFHSLASVGALGAAAENLVLTAHAEGLGVRLTTFPQGPDSPLAATFELCGKGDPDDEPADADRLAAWIPVRVTNRRHAERLPLLDTELGEMTRSISGFPEAQLRWLHSEAELDEAGRLLGASDRLLLLNQQLHREMMSEIQFDAGGDQDRHGRGLPVGTLELNASDRAGMELLRSWPALSLVKEWGGGRNLEKMSRKAIAAASAVGMLTMPGVERPDYFRGGRAFERLWLTTAQLGLALQPMTALSYLFARMNRGAGDELEAGTLAGLHALWPRWAALFGLSGTEAEVLVFRLSRAGPPTCRAMRCPLDEVLQIG